MGKGYLSFAAAVVLQAVAGGYFYGFDIIDITGLPGGTVYPARRRLEEAGYLISKWEKQSIAQKEQRPPRKYYELTRGGVMRWPKPSSAIGCWSRPNSIASAIPSLSKPEE